MASVKNNPQDNTLPISGAMEDVHPDKLQIKSAAQESEAVGRGFSIDNNDLPEGYFRSKYFWGSMFAVGLSLSCGVAGFSFIAPLLNFVNEDIGPSPYLTWVALTYTCVTLFCS
jgi:hypothetical protein